METYFTFNFWTPDQNHQVKKFIAFYRNNKTSDNYYEVYLSPGICYIIFYVLKLF